MIVQIYFSPRQNFRTFQHFQNIIICFIFKHLKEIAVIKRKHKLYLIAYFAWEIVDCVDILSGVYTVYTQNSGYRGKSKKVTSVAKEGPPHCCDGGSRCQVYCDSSVCSWALTDGGLPTQQRVITDQESRSIGATGIPSCVKGINTQWEVWNKL